MNLFECTSEDCCHEWQAVEETSTCSWCQSDGKLLETIKWPDFYGFVERMENEK